MLAPGAAAQQTGTITGHILDRESRKPIFQVAVNIRGTERRALTNAEGAFRLDGIPLGERQLVVSHIAYGEHAEAILMRSEQVLRLQVLLSAQAIQLTPVLVEAESELELRRRSSGSRFNEISRSTIEEGARNGLDLGRLLRDELLGARVNPLGRMGGYCVEYRANFTRPNEQCRAVAVFLDGVRVQAAGNLYTTLPLNDIERIELLSPAEAGARYGNAAGFGVLVIETRRGPSLARAPRPAERLVPGFDWSQESQPYRWPRVLGASFVGNTVGLGVGMLLVDQCLSMTGGSSLLRSKCDAISTVGVSFLTLVLPSAAGSLAARWAGSTDRSRGRIAPSAVFGTLTLASGFLLLVHGASEDSEGARAAGIIVVSVGAPLVLTLGDRAFRALR